MTQPENPYATPEAMAPVLVGQATPNDRSIAPQLLVVGILQTAVGGLELLMGGMLVAMAFIVPLSIRAGAGAPSPPDSFSLWVAGIAYAVLGALALISSCLRLISGIGSFYFRYRPLMIVSLIFGLITSLTCYCALTATPLAIYGMIVLTNPAAKRAFAMRKAGMTPEEIRRSLNS